MCVYFNREHIALISGHLINVGSNGLIRWFKNDVPDYTDHTEGLTIPFYCFSNRIFKPHKLYRSFIQDESRRIGSEMIGKVPSFYNFPPNRFTILRGYITDWKINRQIRVLTWPVEPAIRYIVLCCRVSRFSGFGHNPRFFQFVPECTKTMMNFRCFRYVDQVAGMVADLAVFGELNLLKNDQGTDD